MSFKQVCLLAEENGCKVQYNKPLSEYTTFKIGGNCPAIIEINSVESLSSIIKYCRENNIRYLIIGKGSNMLCDDNGFDGVALHFGTDFSDISVNNDGLIQVQSGCSLMKLCRCALDNSLSGLEFAYGIPGTVGGAIFMNAGAYGGEIKDVLVSAEFVDSDGNVHTLPAEKLDLSYRHSLFHDNDHVITKGVFKLDKGDKSEIKAKMDELMNRRKEKQPLEYPNAGSTFKRPKGQFAGKLVQDCGLKGFSVGGAMVSEKHSGFVINYNNATGKDVKALIEQVQKTVFEKTGFFLECEVKFIPYSE